MKIQLLFFKILSLCMVFFISLSFVQDNHEKFAVVRIIVSGKDDDVKVNLTEIKISNGFYKEIAQDDLGRNEGYLVFQILNEQQSVIKELIYKNPLKVRLEYPNEDKTIGSKEVILPEKEIIIRFNYTTDMKSLQISRINSNGILEKVKIVPLKNE